MSTGKCQAKNPALCIDPACPEKMYLKNAFAAAIARGDFSAFVDAKEQETTLEPVHIWTGSQPMEWDRVVVHNKKTDTYFSTGIDPIVKITYDKDISEVKDFDSWEAIQEEFNENGQGKKGNVTLDLEDIHNLAYVEEDDPLKGFYVANFYVSNKLRGQGVGKHIMDTMTAYADKNGLVMELVPTEAGDGKTMNGVEPNHIERAIAHKKRLVKFYERNGFVFNPYYFYSDRVDFLTKKPHPVDHKAREKYTEKAAKVLRNHSMYIRFPNGKFPKGWLA
jgi:GNAT superfamily N-acetyltransferase